jgi:hypothetical protein
MAEKPLSWEEWRAIPFEERMKMMHHRRLKREELTPEEQAWVDEQTERFYKAEKSG